jgi:apolipoprotein N-acyltransferase
MDFSPGNSPRPLVHQHTSLGLLICYEAIFPELAQESVRQGANILVNISNDTWFGASSAPWQHLYLSVLRAIEQNRFLVRCTNTGISAFVDNRGHILDTTKLFAEQTLIQDTVLPIEATTWYHDWYEYIHSSYAMLPLCIGLWAWTRKPQPHG